MSNLNQLIAEDVLLSLEPEELAPYLLKVAHDRSSKRGSFLFDDIISSTSAIGYPATKTVLFSQSRQHEFLAVANEAWQWLIVNLLIVPAPNIDGKNGRMVLSRRGKAITSDLEFKQYRDANSFPKSMLHPSISDKVWLSVIRGDLDEAVFAAFKAVEIAVRDASGLPLTILGVDLMRKAFRLNEGILADKNQPTAEQEALSNLFAGAIGSYKNPHSHRTVSISDPNEAQEMVMLASHLLRIVDARKPKTA